MEREVTVRGNGSTLEILENAVEEEKRRLQLVDIEADLLAVLEEMQDSERTDLFGRLFMHYCRHCGRNHFGSYCQCWNDE